MRASSAISRSRALALIEQVRSVSTFDRHHLDFIALAIQGKKIGFDKVIAMIDDMVGTLKTEQSDDDNKKNVLFQRAGCI
jgi:hypothetical protein